MSAKTSNKAGIFVMAVAAACGALILLIFPNLATGALNMVAWAAVGVAGLTAGTLHYSNKKREMAAKELEKRKSQQKRRVQREKEKREKEERFQKAQEMTAKKEAARESKQEQIKAEMIKQAEVVWLDREKDAENHEAEIRKIMKTNLDMTIRTVAGYVATEWNDAAKLAQWTGHQLIMFTRRPNVTTKARDEAQEAIIEAEEVRASGSTLSEQQGNELKAKKKKAQEEAKMEEARVKAIQDVIDNAEIKWRGIEMRVNRRQKELDLLLQKNNQA